MIIQSVKSHAYCRLNGVYTIDTEPLSVDIPAEDYLTEDDAVQTILVFAENDLRGPILIDTFTPTPVDG